MAGAHQELLLKLIALSSKGVEQIVPKAIADCSDVIAEKVVEEIGGSCSEPHKQAIEKIFRQIFTHTSPELTKVWTFVGKGLETTLINLIAEILKSAKQDFSEQNVSPVLKMFLELGINFTDENGVEIKKRIDQIKLLKLKPSDDQQLINLFSPFIDQILKKLRLRE